MADEAVSVLVVDDQLPFRMAAKTVVRVTPGFDVVGEAESGEDAVAQVDALTGGAAAYINKDEFGPQVLRATWDGSSTNGSGPS